MMNPHEDAEAEQPSETVITDHGTLTWGPGIPAQAEDKFLYPQERQGLNAGFSQT